MEFTIRPELVTFVDNNGLQTRIVDLCLQKPTALALPESVNALFLVYYG